jgi:hypothetical protein
VFVVLRFCHFSPFVGPNRNDSIGGCRRASKATRRSYTVTGTSEFDRSLKTSSVSLCIRKHIGREKRFPTRVPMRQVRERTEGGVGLRLMVHAGVEPSGESENWRWRRRGRGAIFEYTSTQLSPGSNHQCQACRNAGQQPEELLALQRAHN